MRKIILIAFALALVFPLSQAVSVFIPVNNCGIGTICYAEDVIILSNLSNGRFLAAWMENPSGRLFIGRTNPLERISEIPSALGFQPGSTTNELSGFYDSVTNKAFLVTVDTSSTVTTSKNMDRVFQYDFGANTSSLLRVDACSSVSTTMQGMGAVFKKINSTTAIYEINNRCLGNIPGGGGFERMRYFYMATQTFTGDGDGNATSEDTDAIQSLVLNGTHVLVGASTGGNGLFITPHGYPSLQNYTHYQYFSGAGTQVGSWFYTANDTLYTTNRDGNSEIYTVKANGNDDRRLTITTANESIVDVFNDSDSTNYIAYKNSSSDNTIYLTTICGSGNLGSTCGGVSGGGQVVCSYGYAFNNVTQSCEALPGYNGRVPTSQLIIYDRACAEQPGLTGGVVKNTCPETFTVNPFEIYDYTYVQYLIDGKFATPFATLPTNISSSIAIAANASCVAYLTTAPNDTLPLTSANFMRNYGMEPNAPYFSFEGRSGDTGTFGTFGSKAWLGKEITVNCVSGYPGSSVSGTFIVQDTYKKIAQGGQFVGGYAGSFTDSSNLNESPIGFRRVIRTNNYAYGFPNQIPYGDSGNTACLLNVYSSDLTLVYNQFMPFTSSSSTPDYAEVVLTQPTIGVQNRPAGNYKAVSECRSNTAGTLTELERSPSITISKNYEIKDRCSGVGYQNANGYLQLKRRSGNETSVFSGGENVYANAYYMLNGIPYPKGQCDARLINLTSGAQLDYFSVLNHNDAPYTITIYSNPNNPDPFDPNFVPSTQTTVLTNGSYGLNVSCFNTDTSTCVLPVSFSKKFQVNTSDACAGTNDACTLNSCAACSSTLVTCENGRQKNVQDMCVSRECVAAQSSGSICDSEQLYRIDVAVAPNHLVCGTDNGEVQLSLLKNGQKIPPSTIGDLSCSLTFAPASGQVIDLGNALTIQVTPQTGAYWKYSLQNNFDRFKFDYCGSDIAVYAECLSQNFTSPKKADTRLFIGSMGNDCRYNDAVIKEAQCVFDVTQTDADKGKICLGAQILENPTLCSCPSGTSINATSNTCVGSRVATGILGMLSFKWLSPWVIILLILGLPLVFKAASFFIAKKQVNIEEKA